MFEIFLFVIFGIIFGGLFGALMGLIPYFFGKHTGKPNLGMLGLKWCIGMGVAFGAPAIPVAIGFVVVMIIRDRDYYPTAAAPQAPPVAPPPNARVNTRLGVQCLSGPMKGQTFSVGLQGMMIGRDHDCIIRFAPDVSGISRHHCSLRWQNGVLMLTDLNSANGTFLADGRKLPPQYPTQLAAGSRFYLASTNYLFQIVITG